ncbi:MAG: Holliday junction resolvase RuvX, partial [Clostridiales bacterium]|nr:Holliday junction resolvase RuvX [Clostridiales bacterium]
DFCAQLEQKGLKVEYIDERLTTKSAEMALIEGGMRRQGRKDTVDKVAAALILQSYLDMKRRPKPQQHQEETDMDENKDLPPEFEEEEEFDNIVELTDEDGVTTAFEYQATIELDGAEYVVLMAPEEDEDDEEGSVVIMKIEEQDGEDVYVSVDDDDVAQKVFDLFLEYLDEEEEGEE